MRASWIPELQIQDEYVISGDTFHHLAHVVRIDPGEELLLLNGQGLRILTKVILMNKREMRLQFISEIKSEKQRPMDLALGVPKKDALDLSLKQATELGFRRIYLVRSQYSQTKVPDRDRISSLLVSALEQSNSPYLPEIIEASWEEIPWDEYDVSLMMDSQSKERQNNDQSSTEKSLLIVGPEGGFSEAEITFLHERPKMKIVRLPTPILRTPTAVATGAGILLGRLLDR